MSAALQLPAVWATETSIHNCSTVDSESAAEPTPVDPEEDLVAEPLPEIRLAFYRKHTEKMLRRYLYASMLVGRVPSILGEPVSKGWVSCRRVKTFEDAVIFVLDVERCLKRLGAFDRAILSRVALQEYSLTETATLLRLSVRTTGRRYGIALDRLTKLLLDSGLLILSNS